MTARERERIEEAGEVGCDLGRGPAVVLRRGRGAEARQVEPDDPVSAGEMRHPLGPGPRGFAIAMHQHDRLWRRPRRAEPIVLVGYGEAGPDFDFLHRLGNADLSFLQRLQQTWSGPANRKASPAWADIALRRERSCPFHHAAQLRYPEFRAAYRDVPKSEH